MYNVYAYDKLRRENEERYSKTMKMIIEEKKKKIIDDRYEKKFRMRMNETVLQLYKEVDLENTKRSISVAPSRNKRSKLTNSFKNFDKKLSLDSSSKRSIFRLRPREKDKEIQPPLKFNFNTERERISESRRVQRSLFDTSLPPNSDSKTFYTNFDGSAKQTLSGGKESFDYYHFKTHFKEIESMAMDLHGSLKFSKEKVSLKEKKKQEKLNKLLMRINGDDENNRNTIISSTLTKEEIIPISNRVLEKYGLWKQLPNKHDSEEGRWAITLRSSIKFPDLSPKKSRSKND
ncbi:unnamed protein product [Blepharisma stoltei]|uniref:Uncharacterized protein n=1 Tax=Blepharisma stoltei TaxID=1481888 RepID=A0AAU9K315_9CILI|nr:unnamed protein product [Blepharisma stoltei]